MIGVVIDGHARARLARHVARGDAVKMMRRRITVMTGYADGQAKAGAKPDAVWTNLDIEFVNLVRRERFAPLMGVIRRPGLGTIWIDAPLRTPEPAARQQTFRAVGIDFKQL
jgi:hypothetical protein